MRVKPAFFNLLDNFIYYELEVAVSVSQLIKLNLSRSNTL